MPQKFGTGALLDTRSAAQKEKDWKYEELYSAAAPVVWRAKQPNEWKKYAIRNQNGSGSCVAQTVAKMLGIKNKIEEGRFVDFSAVPIYQRRANKPYSGMDGVDALTIACKFGSTPEFLLPSSMMNDAQMDAVKILPSDNQIGQIFKQKSFLQPAMTIDKVAAMIEEEGCAMVWQFFTYEEWLDVPVIKDAALRVGDARANRHSITAVDYTLWNGQKAIVIEDSWGEFNAWQGQRVLTESWLNARWWFHAILTDLDNSWRDKQISFARPHYEWSRKMYRGMVADPDVTHLQEVLRYEELFPIDSDLTGNFGSITASGLLALQKRYKLASDADLDDAGGNSAGPLTLAFLNRVYGKQ